MRINITNLAMREIERMSVNKSMKDRKDEREAIEWESLNDALGYTGGWVPCS